MNLIQGTEAWLEFRKQGIGSSDSPAVMNVSPYLTAFQLYEQKLGLRPPPDLNWAMQRGQRLEPAARAHYELLNDRSMEPLVAIHKDYPFIYASLDGANEELKRILEIKCAGKDTYLNAVMEKKIPRHHLVQMQHQLLVTGFKQCDYFVYYEGKGALVEVHPDYLFFEKLLKECVFFWDCVQRKLPPPLCKKDRNRMEREERKRGKKNDDER